MTRGAHYKTIQVSDDEVIYRNDDGVCSISIAQCWAEGLYESEQAARFSFDFCCDLRAAMQKRAIDENGGVITLAMMHEMEQSRGLSCGQGAHRRGWQPGDPLIFDDGR